MTPENWERLQPVFDAALDLPTAGRSGYVAELLRRDEQLGRQLKSLLRVHEELTVTEDIHWNVASLIPEDIPLFSPGELLLERFEILHLLGSGGMGDVYEANDRETERIALKAIRPGLVHSSEILARFKREVRLARKIGGSNVCRIHELFMLPAEGRRPQSAFLTMEFLEGATLAARIEEQGRLPWKEAETIALQICEGLAAVHQAGVIHRDLKTRNIMLSMRGGKPAAVLMDFGLAHENARGRALNVQSATVGAGDARVKSVTPGPGTPQYMAPEQWENGDLSPATDVYALGLVLYEMVTGQHPFEGASIVESVLRRAKPLPPPSTLQQGLPHNWDEVVIRCLQYEPRQRFQSADEVAGAIASRPVIGRVRRQAGKIWAKHARLLAVAAFFLVLLLAAAYSYQAHRYYIPSKDAMVWYNRGIDAARQGADFRAATAFAQARDEDPGFALARAHLADTSNDLDFKGKAEEELGAIDAASENRLRSREQAYVEAVRATLHQDYEKATALYRELLDKAADDDKAYGYVELGRSYQRAGKIPDAMKAYREAASLAPESPAAYLRLGFLQGQQEDESAAEQTLARAADLYHKLNDSEGMAEVAWLRSRAAANLSQIAKEKKFLEESLNSAKVIPNIPLEVRALTQLSVVDEDPKGKEEAAQAMRLARENDLPYWEAEALLRQGNKYANAAKPDYPAAEDSLTQAMRSAQKNHWPGLLALSQLSLAGLRDRQGKADPTLAQAAASYFKSVSYAEYAIQALTLVVRAKGNDNDFAGALSSSQELLKLARDFHNFEAVAQAQEAAGQALTSLDRYPEALKHFQAALNATHQPGAEWLAPYETFHCADLMARLGLYDEAAKVLDPILKTEDHNVAEQIALIRAQILLSQSRLPETARLAQGALAFYPKMDGDTSGKLKLAAALAYLQSGPIKYARRLCEDVLTSTRRDKDLALNAESLRVKALIDLAAGQPTAAIEDAASALDFFKSSGQKESEWLTESALAEAERAAGDRAAASMVAKRGLDALAELLRPWPPSFISTYMKRSDIFAARKQLDSVLQTASKEKKA